MKKFLAIAVFWGLGLALTGGVEPAGAAPQSPAQKESSPAVYEPLTLKNLIQLYWKTPMFAIQDDKAVEEYLRVSECKIYREVIKDDFKWPNVLRTTRAYLGQYKTVFSGRFEIVQPIALGRYNVEKNWFHLIPETQYLNVIRLQIADYVGYRNFECSDMPRAKPYPLTAYVRFARPFSITYIPMTPDFAREYLDFIKASKIKSVDIKGGNYDRPAYVRFRMTITGLIQPPDPRTEEEKRKNPHDPRGNPLNSAEVDFSGTLDSYDIFADREMKMNLMSWKNDDTDISSDQKGRSRSGP